MRNVRQKLIAKIKSDTDLEFDINLDTKIFRPTLSWQHKTVGRLVWYWMVDGLLIGSSEKMTDLLKSEKLEVYVPVWGVYELSSS